MFSATSKEIMLTHYIIVRRDLPLGVVTAMVTHAAGESAVLYQDEYDGRFRECRAVVLESANEADLLKAEAKLQRHGVQYVGIVESGEIYKDQLMAIGLVPTHPETHVDWGVKVADVMKHFLTLKELDKPEEVA